MVIRSNNILPHHVFKGFPFTWWPLDGWHDAAILAIGENEKCTIYSSFSHLPPHVFASTFLPAGEALQKVRDIVENYELKKLGMPLEKDKNPTPEMIQTIINLRKGNAVKLSHNDRPKKGSGNVGVKSESMDRGDPRDSVDRFDSMDDGWSDKDRFSNPEGPSQV